MPIVFRMSDAKKNTMIQARRKFLQMTAGAAAGRQLLCSPRARCRRTDYPSRPITLGLPYAAGGGGDALARILAERMRMSLGQPVIVEHHRRAAASQPAGSARRAPGRYSTITGGRATSACARQDACQPHRPTTARAYGRPSVMGATDRSVRGNAREGCKKLAPAAAPAVIWRNFLRAWIMVFFFASLIRIRLAWRR